MRAVRAALSPLAKTFLVGLRETEIVCVCSAGSSAEETGLGAAADDLAASELGLVVGIGRTHDGLEGVRRSYTEARDAARLGSASRYAGRAIRFPDVLLDQILLSARHTDAMLEETVRPLLEYDARKGTELLATLRAYVSTSFTLTRAAHLLSVSPNTVVYRLRRIHALTGMDPFVVDGLLVLALGLRLHDSAPPLG
ncbi:hypothetical protein GCM10010182_59830 [Actinomadura cremea]|nr:hypothetical protein GCM10010182_59830 [Actinomadura cremea]